jgi:hypothetical protein
MESENNYDEKISNSYKGNDILWTKTLLQRTMPFCNHVSTIMEIVDVKQIPEDEEPTSIEVVRTLKHETNYTVG